jgi:hypothetical protein
MVQRAKRRPKRNVDRRSLDSIRPTHDERIASLERRVSAIEATLNGRLTRIEETLASISEGLRANIGGNSSIVAELQEARVARGAEKSASLERAVIQGEKWSASR